VSATESPRFGHGRIYAEQLDDLPDVFRPFAKQDDAGRWVVLACELDQDTRYIYDRLRDAQRKIRMRARWLDVLNDAMDRRDLDAIEGALFTIKRMNYGNSRAYRLTREMQAADPS
jgi:predicted component of type VI protein secretion system